MILITLMALCVNYHSVYLLGWILISSLSSITTIPINVPVFVPYLIYFFIFIILPTFCIFTIICLFKLERWAYWVFFFCTSLLNLILIFFHIISLSMISKHFVFGKLQILAISYFLIFTVYYLLPSTRKLFNK